MMLQESALSSLLTILPKGQVFIDKSSRISYEADGGVDKGLPDGIAFPRTREEAALPAPCLPIARRCPPLLGCERYVG